VKYYNTLDAWKVQVIGEQPAQTTNNDDDDLPF